MHLRKSVRIHIAAFALLAVCSLFNPLTALANDLQSGDLLIGAAVPLGFGNLGNGAILLVRNGGISVFCQSTSDSSAPNYFLNPTAIIADSDGRVVFLAEVGVSIGAPGSALMHCDGIGATPEMLAYFPSTSAMAPGYPVPVIPGVLPAGATFISNGVEAPTASGLHLLSLHTLSLNDLFAGVNTQAAYSLVVGPQGIGATSIRYRTSDQIWEADSQVMSLTNGNIDITSIDAINHSGATYSTNGTNIEKVQDPLTVEASGTIRGTSFSLTLNLFGSANTFPPTPAGGQPTMEYNTAFPQTPSGCFPPAPPLDNSMPTNSSGALLTPFIGSSIGKILYDEFTGYGLIVTTNYGPAGGPWLTNISEDLLDNPGDPTQYFQDGFFGCQAVPFVSMSVPLPFDGLEPPPAGFSSSASPSSKPANTASGPVATQFSSTLPGGTDVIQLVTGTNAPIVVTGAQIAAAGFTAVESIGAYPNGVSAGLTATILLRLDSPVNVLITDPTGKQLGVDALGSPHNDFTGTIVNPITGGSQNVNNGFDSGPGEPRFFGIKNPVPGTYNVQSIGTGSGPYTVHVYSASLGNPVGQAISTSGMASVGSTGSENFTLDSVGNIAFTSVTTGTALVISPSTASFGAPVTFTATVTAANSGIPTGTVSFYSGATFLGTSTVGSSGSATLTSSTLVVGNYSVTAQYSGDNTYAASISPVQLLTVTQAKPVISWGTPAAITEGTTLSAAQLNATANVPGTFVYLPATGTVLTAGSQTLTATFTPTDTTDYSTATATVMLTVNKAASVITWVTPAAVTYGTALSAAQLNATANVPGTFVYSPASGTVLTAGSKTLNVTFTPTDTTDYNTATASVTLTVNKATSVITWVTPAAVTYGTALSAAQLNATANVPGTFVYSPASGTVLTAGSKTLNVTFTPTDTTDYNTATASVTLTVNKAASVITWATPAAITYGTALSSAQLNATANVPGAFVYSPISGTVLTVGSQTLNVTFTPTDTTDYNTATASVTLQVNQAPSGFTITVIPPQETVFRGDVAAFILQLQSVRGFNGNVTLSCTGGPAGSECADLPMTVRVDGTAYAISGILFPKNSTPGTYTITFTGVSGVITSTATATFTVK